MLGGDYSTKLAPWLAAGCISPRWVLWVGALSTSSGSVGFLLHKLNSNQPPAHITETSDPKRTNATQPKPTPMITPKQDRLPRHRKVRGAAGGQQVNLLGRV
jgi:hypothetical protein